MDKSKSETLHHSFQTATGAIPYNMTNDYMFRVVLQENEFVLRGLVGSLLHLEQSEITSVLITNPIKPGEQIDSKTFILDINVFLNDDTNLNLEMQVVNPLNWPDRSLSYLCRMYDDLHSGQNYKETNRAIHIGILDFTLFQEHPEFYACYKMLNIKNYHVFSDKFILHVLDLNQINQATDEDRLYQIDRWAQMFKATTWEELRMIAEKNQYMSEAAAKMYELNADEIVRQQCRAREEYERHERWMQRLYKEAKQETEAVKQETEAAKQETEAVKQEIEVANRKIETANRKTKAAEQTIAEQQKRIAELEALLQQQTTNG